MVEGDVVNGSVMAGQSAAMIHDILPCKEIIEKLIAQTETVMKGMGNHE